MIFDLRLLFFWGLDSSTVAVRNMDDLSGVLSTICFRFTDPPNAQIALSMRRFAMVRSGAVGPFCIEMKQPRLSTLIQHQICKYDQ